MFLARLLDPALSVLRWPTRPMPAVRNVGPGETLAAAGCFISARTRTDPLVTLAYQQLQMETDRQFAVLTDPQGPYRIDVVSTGQVTPYCDAAELIASVLSSRTLEVTTSAADQAHPLLDGEPGGAYYRFRAVHDLIGHVATGYGFDRDGEYSAWLVQRARYTAFPAGPPPPNCTARSAPCGRPGRLLSTKQRCSTPACSAVRPRCPR